MNIARRFLLSKKSHSIVNLVAKVSVVAITVPVVALVLVLSLQNGLVDFIHSMYGQVDSELQVSASKGPFFRVDSSTLSSLRSDLGDVSTTVQGNALIKYGDRQTMVSLRGVDSVLGDVIDIRSTIVRGEWRLDFGGMPRAVLGAGVSYDLAYGLASGDHLELYALQDEPMMMSLLGVPFFDYDSIVGVGVFQLDAATDRNVVFVPIDFARALFRIPNNELSTLEIKLRAAVNQERARSVLTDALGGQNVEIKNSEQQRDMIYRVMNVEKWVIMLMLVFVALIAAMSLSGCMLMMLSEKGRAIDQLAVMGMRRTELRKVFVRLGMMIVVVGVLSGIAVGALLVGIQSWFEVLKMGGDSFILSAYPVRVAVLDLVVIAGSVLTIGYLIVSLTVGSIIKNKQ